MHRLIVYGPPNTFCCTLNQFHPPSWPHWQHGFVQHCLFHRYNWALAYLPTHYCRKKRRHGYKQGHTNLNVQICVNNYTGTHSGKISMEGRPFTSVVTVIFHSKSMGSIFVLVQSAVLDWPAGIFLALLRLFPLLQQFGILVTCRVCQWEERWGREQSLTEMVLCTVKPQLHMADLLVKFCVIKK